MKTIFTLLSLVFLSAAIAQKQTENGTLDSSFGNNGKVLTALSNGYLDCAGSGLQSDGSIIAGGSVSFINSNTDDFFAIKYLPDGKQDNSFGKKGMGVIKGLGEAQTVAVQKDNKILIAGYDADIAGTYRVITAGRLNADGSVDSAFGTNGSITTNLGENCNDIAIQPDGKILITGTTGIAFITLRYMANGTPDESFGSNGSVVTKIDNGSPKLGNANIIQPDGKIVVAGGDNHKIMLVRYNADGSLDETFGNNGQVVSDISSITNPLNVVNDMVLQPDGKLVLAGTTATELGVANTILLRYMLDGSFDTTFGKKGIVVRVLQYNSSGASIALQKDNKIVIAGNAVTDGINNHFLTERFNADGSIDSSFDYTGYQITVMDENDIAIKVLLQNDGKILLAGDAYNSQQGTASYEVAFARYITDDKTQKQIIITKIKRWLQHHNGFTWDNNNNVSSYVVQRSYDGIHFSSIAKINAANASNAYADPSPLSRNNYYRLQTTSVNGAVNYSNVIAVTAEEDAIKISPNPAKNNLQIQGLSSSNTKLSVVDFSGNIKLQASSSNTSYNLNIASFKPGTYLLKIESSGEVASKKFVKE
ncbi:MAG: T9SS type A sorting domain-containing protein [Parafilimonas sp.]